MWAHDLRRVGRVDEAIAEFRRAYDLETAYYRAESLPPDVDWHRPHNLDLLATCYQHQGRNRLAEETMREREQVHAAFAGMEFNRKNWPGFLLSTGRAEQSLAAARELLAGRWESTWPIGHALAGEALLALGRLAEAEAELVRAQETLARLPATQTFGYVTRGSVEPHVDMLRGQVLLARGRREEAREVLQTVQRTLRSVPGPDAWTEALFRLEAIAEAARRAGDWELAAYTAEQMRDHDPAYAGTHYALGLVAEHAGDRARARTEFEEAVRLWARADTDLPALRAARARRDALAADASSTQRPPRSAESAETK
jgi:tetratricopeptide (TPR) repeat protein